MRSSYPKAILILLIYVAIMTVFFSGCETSTEPQPGSTPSDSVSVFIDAAIGGQVNLSGIAAGAVLNIPPGAMAESGEISAIATAGSSPGSLWLRFEPEGLEFQQPVQLTVPVGASPKNSDLDNLVGLFKLALSPSELLNSGSELNPLTMMSEIVKWSADTISGEMQHLRQVVMFSWRESYLVVDIPGKYLRPGDGLFVMSGDETNYQFRWAPGHVGMISYANPDSAVTTVVESTIGGPTGDGVQTNTLLRFKRTGGHLYLGARRPPGEEFDDGLRQSSLLEARSHLGEPYAYLGGDFGGYNCTGLLEGAWDSIGRGVMGNRYRFFFPTEMYNATEPVTEIEVRVAEELRIPVYPAVISPTSTNPALPSHFLAGPETGATILATGLPQGSTFDVDVGVPYLPNVLVWTPDAAASDSTFTVTFIMQGTATTSSGITIPFTRTQNLDIHVLGKSSEITVFPVGFGSTGNTINLHFPLPAGAQPAPPSNDHLIDLATGQYPASVVFDNQVFDNFSEGWLGGDPESGYYGASMHITRNNPWGQTPTGTRTWVYSIGYATDRYRGLR